MKKKDINIPNTAIIYCSYILSKILVATVISTQRDFLCLVLSLTWSYFPTLLNFDIYADNSTLTLIILFWDNSDYAGNNGWDRMHAVSEQWRKAAMLEDYSASTNFSFASLQLVFKARLNSGSFVATSHPPAKTEHRVHQVIYEGLLGDPANKNTVGEDACYNVNCWVHYNVM